MSPEEELDARREAAGLDEPLIEQYFEYLGNALTLDLGTTINDDRKVTSIIVENGSATLELTMAAFSLALVVGISIGILAGYYRDTWIDLSGRMFGIIVYAAPVFFTGYLAQLLFAGELGWLPSSGQGQPDRRVRPRQGDALLSDRHAHHRQLGRLLGRAPST